jgi:hypothetical protein
MCIDHPAVFLRRELSFHGSVSELGKGQLAAKTLMVKRHCLSAIAIE